MFIKGYGPEDLAVVVEDPYGNSLPTVRRRDPNHANVITCTFRPIYCGLYAVSVTSVNDGTDHIEGSPFRMAISRNYDVDRMTSLVNFSVIPAAVERPVKAWGIASNYYSDIVSE